MPGDFSFQPPRHAHIGVDEAGRGCLAGPVVAGAVLAPEGYDFASALPGLTDSKALNEKRREALRQGLMNSELYWAVGFSWPDEIDRVNILNATFRAMSRAVCAVLDKLRRRDPDLCGQLLREPEFGLYIDGSQSILLPQWQAAQAASGRFTGRSGGTDAGGLAGRIDHDGQFGSTGLNALPEPAERTEQGELNESGGDSGKDSGLWSGGCVDGAGRGESVEFSASKRSDFAKSSGCAGPGAERWVLPQQRSVVKGDLLVPSISAASILAKTQRDLLMRALDGKYPGYGFAAHKGYGTKEHMSAVAALGECPMHRKSFCKGGKKEARPDQFSLLG